MNIIYRDAWKLYDESDNNILCITTNGFIKRNGANVMGAGIAKQAKERFKNIDFNFGNLIKKNGHIVQPIGDRLLSFPVKDFWYNSAKLDIIIESLKQLRAIALFNPDKLFILPKPGCGNGKLKWCDIEDDIKKYIVDNIIIVDFKNKNE